jgi:hypothetical protein
MGSGFIGISKNTVLKVSRLKVEGLKIRNRKYKIEDCYSSLQVEGLDKQKEDELGQY